YELEGLNRRPTARHYSSPDALRPLAFDPPSIEARVRIDPARTEMECEKGRGRASMFSRSPQTIQDQSGSRWIRSTVSRRRRRVRSLPSTASVSKSGGEALRPVAPSRSSAKKSLGFHAC